MDAQAACEAWEVCQFEIIDLVYAGGPALFYLLFIYLLLVGFESLRVCL